MVSGAAAYNYHSGAALVFRVSTDASCSVGTDPAAGNTHAITNGGWTGGTVPISRVLTFTGPAQITLWLAAAKGGSPVGGETVEGTQLVATFYPT